MQRNTAILIGVSAGIIVVIACMIAGAIIYPPMAAPMIAGATAALGLLGAKIYKEVATFLASRENTPATSVSSDSSMVGSYRPRALQSCTRNCNMRFNALPSAL